MGERHDMVREFLVKSVAVPSAYVPAVAPLPFPHLQKQSHRGPTQVLAINDR
jgi:hypothetical protein